MQDANHLNASPLDGLRSGAESLFRKMGLRPHVEEKINLDRASTLTWAQVQSLVRTAYERRGYTVESMPRGDSPVDMLLRKGDERVFLECRHWQVWEVPDKVVHEVAGYSTGAGANRAIMVTSGHFTDHAQAYAARRGMELVDGSSLGHLVTDSPSRS
jgi:restriction system protein